MLRDKELDLDLISSLAEKDQLIITKNLVQDEDVLDLSEPLKKHKDLYKKLQLRAAGNYLELQGKFAVRLFILVCVWLSIVIVCVFFSGFKAWNFTLSDNVLIAFITSTTVTVLGLFALVAKWLFQQNSPEK